MRRAGFDIATRKAIKEAYRLLYRSGLNVPQAVERMQSDLGDIEAAQTIIAFIKGSVRGICRHAATREQEYAED
jgi:UDP-N-acetylglucosamine acyltransferase